MRSSRVVCREVLTECRPAWLQGHGDRAWSALAEAEHLAGDDECLAVEVLAMRAALHLLAEQVADAVVAAREAIDRGTMLLRADRGCPETRHAVADARVTLASMADAGPYPHPSVGGGDALVQLQQVVDDHTLPGEIRGRAINNGLLLRVAALHDRLDSTTGQVEAWVRVSEARTLVRQLPHRGTVLRQALDLGMYCGQWERAWSSAQEQLGDDAERNELIATLAKASVLAWHRGSRAEARSLGERARSLSVAVDHPWVRVYAYLGGVVAAASGGGDLVGALRAYTRCTSRAGHASRRHRAWEAAYVALESGCPPEDVEFFLTQTQPGGLSQRSTDESRIVLADARGQDVDQALAERLLQLPVELPMRARVHLALARTYRRAGRPSAAGVELARARRLLADWPGWLLDQVEQEADVVARPVAATKAQRRVLGLLAEGMSDAAIAQDLGLSRRTVAVHVAAMLRANDEPSRTALAARHVRSQLAVS